MVFENDKGEILVVTSNADLGSLYDTILRSRSHLSRLSTYKEIVGTVLEPSLQLIVLHFDAEFITDLLEFLSKVYQTYGREDRPAILLIGHKDWSDPRIESLVDTRVTFPVLPEYFLEVVEDLLWKGSS